MSIIDSERILRNIKRADGVCLRAALDFIVRARVGRWWRKREAERRVTYIIQQVILVMGNFFNKI